MKESWTRCRSLKAYLSECNEDRSVLLKLRLGWARNRRTGKVMSETEQALQPCRILLAKLERLPLSSAGGTIPVVRNVSMATLVENATALCAFGQAHSGFCSRLLELCWNRRVRITRRGGHFLRDRSQRPSD